MLPRRMNSGARGASSPMPERARSIVLRASMCAALCALAPAHLSAQKLQFRQLTPDNGLSSSLIQSIVQDSRGFMWFATRKGLNRYDGTGFTIYKHKADDSTTVSDNNTLVLYEDSQKSLWVGTPLGISRYDRDHDDFRNYAVAQGASIEVDAILEAQETLWLGTTR